MSLRLASNDVGKKRCDGLQWCYILFSKIPQKNCLIFYYFMFIPLHKISINFLFSIKGHWNVAAAEMQFIIFMNCQSLFTIHISSRRVIVVCALFLTLNKPKAKIIYKFNVPGLIANKLRKIMKWLTFSFFWDLLRKIFILLDFKLIHTYEHVYIIYLVYIYLHIYRLRHLTFLCIRLKNALK